MKFNLKNRPGLTRRRYPKGECTSDIEEMLEWFEGFEKELREALKRNPPMAAVEVIKEILGETP